MSLRLVEVGEDAAISVNDFGDPHGFPIVVNHGMIASIEDCDLFARLVGGGRRVICIARPGYGESSPFELANVGEWGTVAAGVLKKLNIEEFDVLGLSSGAPYSYAMAHEMPETSRNVYIFSGTPALFDERVVSQWPYPMDANARLPDLQKLAKDLFFSNVQDKENKAIQDSCRHDCFGVALDLKIRCQDWGFYLPDIKTRVIMEHGMQDTSVPFATAEMTSRMLGNCVLTKRMSGDHFSAELLNEFFKNIVHV